MMRKLENGAAVQCTREIVMFRFVIQFVTELFQLGVKQVQFFLGTIATSDQAPAFPHEPSITPHQLFEGAAILCDVISTTRQCLGCTRKDRSLKFKKIDVGH